MLNRLRVFFRKYQLKLIYNLKLEQQLLPSNLKIDVVIPVIKRDLDVLRHCIDSIRKNVSNSINDIIIVSPDAELKNFSKNNGLKFIPEKDIITPEIIRLINDSSIENSRKGWFVQQIIKLDENIAKTPYYLVVDADHILNVPHIFLTNNEKSVFYMSEENHKPYYDIIKKLINKKHRGFSYVSHKMLFKREEVLALKSSIADNKYKYWWERILNDSNNLKSTSFFSEYELYGNWIENENKVLLPWNDASFPRSKINSLMNLKNKKYSSLTFPNYL